MQLANSSGINQLCVIILLLLGLKQIYRIFEFVFHSNSFETIIVIQNTEITVKMAETSNEESLLVSTTTTDTALEMYQ